MTTEENESDFVMHLPCSNCGSSDGNSLYSDGHTFCFVCNTYTGSNTTVSANNNKRKTGDYSPIPITYQHLRKRGITEETCRKYGYGIGEYKGKKVQIANYVKDNVVVGQKLRFPDKDFKFLTDGSAAPLFGQHIWNRGKKIIVTEGEIDCLTVSQVQNNKYPVVSIPNGANGAKKAIQNNLEYFDSFEEVILMFDNDQAGTTAAKQCAALFPVGKCKIASLPMKDPSEMMQKGTAHELVGCIWNAKDYRPDGIIAGVDTWEAYQQQKEKIKDSIPYPWECLNNKTRGMRRGELVVITSGTGIGKSTLCREIAYYLSKEKGEKVGYLALEESVGRTVQCLLSLELNIPLHLRPEEVTEEMERVAWDKVFGTDLLYLYDHFGSTDVDTLLSKMRYMVRACECKWLFLDHLSIVVSGLTEGDERRLIDNIMTTLRKFVEETDVGLFVVSHLKRGGGKTHEEGGRVSLGQLRGSGAIAQLADIGVGGERDQQSEDSSDVMLLRVLKNRFSGETGVTGYLKYDVETGRLSQTTVEEEDIGKEFRRDNAVFGCGQYKKGEGGGGEGDTNDDF